MNILTKLASLEKKASDFGFKWETSDQIIKQIQSEISEACIHLNDGDQNKLQDEIGDLLHAVFSLCIFNELNPKETLTRSVKKFERRFNAVQQLAIADGLSTLQGKSFADLMIYWDKAKRLL